MKHTKNHFHDTKILNIFEKSNYFIVNLRKSPLNLGPITNFFKTPLFGDYPHSENFN